MLFNRYLDIFLPSIPSFHVSLSINAMYLSILDMTSGAEPHERPPHHERPAAKAPLKLQFQPLLTTVRVLQQCQPPRVSCSHLPWGELFKVTQKNTLLIRSLEQSWTRRGLNTSLPAKRRATPPAKPTARPIATPSSSNSFLCRSQL